MDETGKVSGVGQGFFSETGQLKSKEQIIADKGTSSKNPKIDASNFSSSISNAIGSQRSKFQEQANEAVSAVNANEDNLKAAKSITKEQLAAAKDLKKAIKTEDQDAIKSSRKELQRLEKQRQELSQKIQEDNSEQASVRHQTLNFGNQQKGIVEVQAVDFRESSGEIKELDSTKDVEQYIQGLNDDLDSLKAQVKDQKDTKAQVKVAIEEVDRDVQKIQGDAIRSFDEASKTANKIAQDIRSGGLEIFQNVSVSAVQRLLAS